MIEQSKTKSRGGSTRSTHTSLARGLQILEVIADSSEPASLSDTARKVNLPRSTTHHIMQTLMRLGYLRQDEESRTYELGEKAARLSRRGLSTSRIAELSLPLLKEICTATGESATIAALLEDQVTLIAIHDADGPVRIVQDVGAQRPVHCTAMGKVLAAWLSSEKLSALLSTLRFEPFTSKTILQRDRFEAELRRVRKAGVAYDREEFMPGVRCVAAPVFGQGDEPIAALGLTGPRHRLQQRRMREYAPLVQRYANVLSERLSSVG